MNWLAKLRFLPVTIFFAALMLTFKVGDIWTGADGLVSPIFQLNRARAQESEKKTSTAKSSEAQNTSEVQREGGAKKNNVESEGQAQGVKLKSESTKSIEFEKNKSNLEGEVTIDPTFLTPEEIEVLQQLALRRDQLDEREREMDLRNGLLNAAEGRIDQKIVELQKLRSTIDNLIKKYDKQQDAKLTSLVKIYENMKPKDAARIFEELEMDTLLEMSERMKERKLAGIIAKMSPQKAREVTVELRRLRNLPQVGSQLGG
tara:strand:- start:287 stop:1066 length:780 start_codon:yes stop_codon:yes gene_type:complete